MKKILMLSVLVLGVFALGGCGTNKIVGSWELNSFVYTFNKDNTCTYNVSGEDMKCTYKIDGDKLSIMFDNNTVPFDTTYKIEKNKLIIKDSYGKDVEYTKK